MPSQYVTLGRAQYGCTFDNKLYLKINTKFLIPSQGLAPCLYYFYYLAS